MDQQTRRYLLFMLAGVIGIAIIIGFYFAFRRTLIADVREAMLVSENTDFIRTAKSCLGHGAVRTATPSTKPVRRAMKVLI